MLYSLKAQFQKFAIHFAHSGLTANHATILGFIFVLLTMMSFYFGLRATSPQAWILLVPLALLCRLIMNALDGMLARAQGTASAAGEIMNELSDVLGDTFSYGVLYFVLPEARTEIVFFLLAIWCCEFLGVLGKGLPAGKRRQESVGGGKPERAVFLSVFALIIYFQPAYLQFADKYFVVLSILVMLSAMLRAVRSIQSAKNQKYSSDPQLGR